MTIIPPKIGRRTTGMPTGYYRAMMRRRFPKKLYGQRWQAETAELFLPIPYRTFNGV